MKREDMSEEDIQALADAAVAWVNSDEGQHAIKAALERAQRTIEYLREVRKVSEKSWNELGTSQLGGARVGVGWCGVGVGCIMPTPHWPQVVDLWGPMFGLLVVSVGSVGCL